MIIMYKVSISFLNSCSLQGYIGIICTAWYIVLGEQKVGKFVYGVHVHLIFSEAAVEWVQK